MTKILLIVKIIKLIGVDIMADYKINKTNGTVQDGAGLVWKLLTPIAVDKTGGVGNISDINSSDSKFIKKILDSFTQWLSNKFRG